MEKFKKLPRPSKKLVGLLIGIAALYYAGSTIPSRMSFSPTDSVGYHFFFLKRHFKPSELQRGTLVVLPLYTHVRPNCWPCLIVKYIECDSGQRLDVRNKNEFFCDNFYLGSARSKSSTGVPVKAFQYHGIIPKGKMFLMGVTSDSYDSRYIGLEKKSNVKAIAIPLF